MSYEKYILLRTEKKCRTNTVWGCMIVLKHIVSIARNDGRLPFNPFAGYINSPESVDRGYLTQTEIQTLIDEPMKNADPTRTHLNRRLIGYPDGVKDRSAAVQRRLEEAGLTRKIGSNQVRAIRINVSGTHEDMKRIEEEGRLDEWCADNLKYFADTFGKENIVAAHLHRDEETIEVLQDRIHTMQAENTPTYTTAKEKQGIQAINVKSCPICRKSAVRRLWCTALFLYLFARTQFFVLN